MNIYEPHPRDVVAWAEAPDSSWPAADWDFYVMYGRNDDLVLSLANSYSCPKRDFFRPLPLLPGRRPPELSKPEQGKANQDRPTLVPRARDILCGGQGVAGPRNTRLDWSRPVSTLRMATPHRVPRSHPPGSRRIVDRGRRVRGPRDHSAVKVTSLNRQRKNRKALHLNGPGFDLRPPPTHHHRPSAGSCLHSQR